MSTTITAAALPISNPGGKDIYGQNNGTSNLYLSTQQDVSPTNYKALVGPGGSFSWPATEALYACTDMGQQTFLDYLTNGATVNSGSTFSQASNQPQLLGTIPLTVGADSNAYLSSLNNLDVGSYASLEIVIALVDQAGPNFTPTVSNFIGCLITQLDDTNIPNPTDSPVSFEAQWLLLSPTTEQLIQSFAVPVKRSQADVSIFINKLVTATSGHLVAYIYGTGQVLSGPQYVSQGAGLQGNSPEGGFSTLAGAGATNGSYIATKNGPARIGMYNATGVTNGQASLQISDNGTNTIIEGLLAGTAGGSFVGDNCQLPCRPIFMTAFSASGTVIVSLIQP